MILHELVTNAAKYGALSKDEGSVAVSWSLQQGGDRMLSLAWREKDGPPAEKPPQYGFGLKLIERESRTSLNGRAKIEFLPEGLVVNLAVPLKG